MKKIFILMLTIITLNSLIYTTYAESYDFELPIKNSTGYTTIKTKIYNDINFQNVIGEMNGGTPFTILEENADSWKIENSNGDIGWIKHRYCMINLPDIIPSIVYKNTNGYSSIYKSRGYDLPNVTGSVMYDSYHYNEKLHKDEYVVPCLYSMAKKIHSVQQDALKNKETLILYEAYRPYNTQMAIVESLKSILNIPEVNDGITGGGWSISWFIATGYSNHQLGYAIDTSLGKIIKSKNVNIGCNYNYQEITEYKEYDMQTSMHELSRDSISLAYGVDSLSKTAWKSVPIAKSMNETAIKLRDYCTNNGLSPLASEWWHFNDLDSRESIKGYHGKADWDASICLSKELKYSNYGWINKIGETILTPNEIYQTLYQKLLE